MTIWESLILGVVEGLTEFLPVSSTGHLILASKFLHLPDTDAVKAFEVVIQSGAMGAVLWFYRDLWRDLFRGLIAGRREAVGLALSIAAAFMPAAVIGLAFHKRIKAVLFGPGPVVIALAVGGVAMILIERVLRRRRALSFATSPDPGLATAFKIGCFQCLALWPGMSRSMTTILGGRLCGLTSSRAAEFSFLLATPTLLAASFLDLAKHGSSLVGQLGWGPLVVGLLSSFVVSLAVIRGLLEFVKSYSLEVFGWYRLVAALLVGLFLL